MRDIAGLMKQAEGLKRKMEEAQAELERTLVEGQSGGGMVKITLNGKGDLTKMHLDPLLLNKDEAEILEDLIMAAHNDARKKLDDAKAKSMGAMTEGISLPPGFKLPF